MAALTMTPYIPYDRIVLEEQEVDQQKGEAVIRARPDRRFTPICYECGGNADGIQVWRERKVRDLNLAATKVTLECSYRMIECNRCGGYCVEDLKFFDRYQRVTHRLARAVYQMAQKLDLAAVADHFDLHWTTVKKIDKEFLEKEYAERNYDDLRILAVDEVALRKGHSYMTVVLNYETGEVVWMGEDRKADTLKEFFGELNDQQKESVEAIAMDMWDPFIKAVREEMEHVSIVFDLYHMVQAFNKVIDNVRNAEKRQAEGEGEEVLKGTKYLLYKNPENRKKKNSRNLNDSLISTRRFRK